MQAVRVSLSRPGHALRFARTIFWQARAARKRKAWKRRGVQVPAIIIFSITHKCNLDCAGCYAKSILGAETAECAKSVGGGASNDIPAVVSARPELSDAKLASIVTEAVDLGVSFFVVAGGEPLMREEILEIAQRHPRVIFLLFTNGLLLEDPVVERIGRLGNIVPLISLEGSAEQTDARRGAGVYERLVAVMDRLQKRGVFFGCSLTLTSRNFSTIFADEYISGLVGAGCQMFLLADYTPVEPGTDSWVLDPSDRDQVQARVQRLRERHKALFVAVPWDEQETGGCLAAGRGFVHINASGEVEPCPFAPFSADDLNQVSLLEALQSPFLARLREMPEVLEYVGAGCELWNHRDQVEGALAETKRPEA